MNYAVNSGQIEFNPLIKLFKVFPKAVHEKQPTIDASELPAFLRCMSSGVVENMTYLLMKWQLVTMVRPGEVVTVKWCEIDFDKKLWTIPPIKMKSRREHIVPLSTQALSILEEAMEFSRPRKYVFPSFKRMETDHMSKQTVNIAIRHSMFMGRIVPHGFRALTSTILNDVGFNPDAIEACLSHKVGGTIRNTYNRTNYLERRRVIMQWLGDYIASAEKGISILFEKSFVLRAV